MSAPTSGSEQSTTVEVRLSVRQFATVCYYLSAVGLGQTIDENLSYLHETDRRGAAARFEVWRRIRQFTTSPSYHLHRDGELPSIVNVNNSHGMRLVETTGIYEPTTVRLVVERRSPLAIMGAVARGAPANVLAVEYCIPPNEPYQFCEPGESGDHPRYAHDCMVEEAT